MLKLKQFFTKLIDLIYPSRCVLCQIYIKDQGLCSACWKKINFISKPWCNICSYPFSFEPNSEVICGNCVKKSPNFDKAFSSLRYDENSRDLIHHFKFNDQTYLTKIFAQWILNNVLTILAEIDYIVPVPLHKYRLLKRKYNQSALLTKHLSKVTKIKTLQQALIKIKNTKPQSSLSKVGRLKSAKNAYKINLRFIDVMKGKNILLIDDVFTTGATLNECAKVLKNAGCKRVFVATIARTVIN